MKTTTWILGAILAIIGYTYLTPTTPDTVSTNGECLTTAPRDRTAITLRVTTLDKNALKSMRAATQQMAEINTYLAALDVKTQTTEFNSYEKTEWNHSTQKSVNLGTETTIAVEVSADNMDIIEQIINQFAGQPNIYVGNLQMFTSAETLKPIMEECLGDAVRNARERANALVSGADRRVGKILSVTYGDATYNAPTANYRLMSAKAVSESMDMGAGAFGTLSSKDTNVSVKVSATFEIR
ncbi:MAG: SIMPL domain-containing protein [Alphaproteobacteria bacterium]|nr:SIMPL domain-containing protein [Alphaproteobacteria bacterium]